MLKEAMVLKETYKVTVNQHVSNPLYKSPDECLIPLTCKDVKALERLAERFRFLISLAFAWSDVTISRLSFQGNENLFFRGQRKCSVVEMLHFTFHRYASSQNVLSRIFSS